MTLDQGNWHSSGEYVGVSRRRKWLIALILCLLSVVLWCLTWGGFNRLMSVDPWTAVMFHQRGVIVAMAVYAACAIGAAWWLRLSVGWPIAALLIGVLVLLLAPAVATSEDAQRAAILANPHGEFRTNTVEYFKFSAIQLLGFLLARRLVRPKSTSV